MGEAVAQVVGDEGVVAGGGEGRGVGGEVPADEEAVRLEEDGAGGGGGGVG